MRLRHVAYCCWLISLLAVSCKRREPPVVTPPPVAADRITRTAVAADTTAARLDSTKLETFLDRHPVAYDKELPSAKIPGYRAGLIAYQAGDYVTAQRELRTATRKQRLDWEIWFYTAMSAYLTGDTREAIHGFEMVERYSAPEVPRMQARWYQANAYLLEGSITRGSKVLEFIARQNRQYAAEAQALLAKISELRVADRVMERSAPEVVRER
ncbi:hypothetical protein HZB60_11425 [candidate division KSB1 bacterium]|nr:hypothetical protein [candidate division KSB1 bacterium]